MAQRRKEEFSLFGCRFAKAWLDRGETAANCVALAVMAFSIFIMIDLVQAAFNLDPRKLPGAKC